MNDIPMLFELAILPVVAIFIALYWVYRNFLQEPLSRPLPKLSAEPYDTPIMSSQGLFENEQLIPVKKCEVEGYECTIIANALGRMMIFVQLKRNTGLHIVAIGSKSGIMSKLQEPQLQSFLAPVSLEGDYPEYFSMFCSKGKEIELLQLFDPTEMAYFVDFCKAYDFELFHDTLYISQAGKAHDKDDTTGLISDVKTFLQKNESFLQRVKSDLSSSAMIEI